jgi:AcrR family transcriptional regulator
MTHDQRAKMRARILEAARERFLDEGLDGLSMRGIASKVGVSSMTLYLYYESRQDIVRHITIDGFKQLNAAVEKAFEGAKPADKLRTLATAYLDWALENKRWYAAMYNYIADEMAEAPGDPLLAGPSTLIADLMKKQLIAAGHTDASASWHSTYLWGALHGVAILSVGGQAEQRGITKETLLSQLVGSAEAAIGEPVELPPKLTLAAVKGKKK